MMRVLLVEDEATIRRATAMGLERDGFDVEVAADGPAGLAAFLRTPPDIALVDVMLPGLDGVALCRRIRAESTLPIVLVSARTDPVDVVLGLEAGADDYVTKPFDPAVLSARLRAVVRRSERIADGAMLRAGSLTIDTAGATVERSGLPLSLTPTEYRLLVDLARRPGRVRTRDELLASVWGYDWSGDTRLVDVHIQRLRAKVGPGVIETVRGLGYKAVRS